MIETSRAYLYAKWCVQKGNRKVGKYVKLQAKKWLKIADGKHKDAYEEGRNPLGLKFIRLGLDTVIYDPETKMIYTPNTKEWTKLEQKGGGEPIAGRNQS